MLIAGTPDIAGMPESKSATKLTRSLEYRDPNTKREQVIKSNY